MLRFDLSMVGRSVAGVVASYLSEVFALAVELEREEGLAFDVAVELACAQVEELQVFARAWDARGGV